MSWKRNKERSGASERGNNGDALRVPHVDYYAALELTSAATIDDIKRNYRRLSLKFHPDRNPNGTEQFKLLSEAYSVLSNDELRGIYDRSGTQGVADYSHLTDEQKQTMLDYAMKLWKTFLAGWSILLLADYILGFPLEWIILTLGGVIVLFLQRRNIPMGPVLVLIGFDAVVYFLFPSSFLIALVKIGIVVTAVTVMNFFYMCMDCAILTVVAQILYSYFIDSAVSSSRFVHFCGANSLAATAFVLAMGFLMHAEQPAVLRKPSFIMMYARPALQWLGARKLSRHILELRVPEAAFVFLPLLVIWILDYFICYPLEWLGITVLMALNVLNGPLITKFRLSIVVSSMLVYLLVPNRYIQILAGILFIIQMLVVLYLSTHGSEIVDNHYKPVAPHWTYYVVGTIAIFIDQFFRTFPARWHILGSLVCGGVAANLFYTLYWFNDSVTSVVREFEEADDPTDTDEESQESVETRHGAAPRKRRRKEGVQR